MVTTRGRGKKATHKKEIKFADDDESYASRKSDSDSDHVMVLSEDEDDLELVQKARKPNAQARKPSTRKKLVARQNKKTSDDFSDSSDSDNDDDNPKCKRPRMPPPKLKKPSPKKKNPPADSNKKNELESEGDHDDESDDDSDDSDIGKRLDIAKRGHVKQQSWESSSSEDDDDDSDKISEDSDSDDGGQSSEGEEAAAKVQPGKRPRFAVRLALRNKKLKMKRAVRGGKGDDSDSGSDTEVVQYAAAAKGKKKKIKVDDFDISSDEEDRPKTSTVGKVGTGYSKAMAELKSAQDYHADELDEEEEEEESDSECICVSSPTRPVLRNSTNDASIPNSKKISSGTATGPQLRLKLRTQEFNVDGSKKGGPREEVFQVGKLQPLENLLQQYLTKNNLNQQTATITMKFEGEAIECNQNPQSYDMENDEIVDVTLKPSLGQVITVKLRKEREENTFQIRTLEPLQSLLDKYLEKKKITAKTKRAKFCLKFDGETLDLCSTAATHDMEDGELVDVFARN